MEKGRDQGQIKVKVVAGGEGKREKKREQEGSFKICVLC